MKWIRLPTLLCIVLAAAAAYGDRSSRRVSSNTYAAPSQLNRAYGPTLAQPTAAQSDESPSDVQPLDSAPAEEMMGDGYGYPFHSRCCEEKPYFAASLWSGYCAEKTQRVPHMGGKHCRSCGGGWSSWRMSSDCGCQEPVGCQAPVASCCPPLLDFHWLHGHLHLRGKRCCECDCGCGEEVPSMPESEGEGEGAEVEASEASAMYHNGMYNDSPILDSGPLGRLHRRMFGGNAYADDGPYDGQIVIESEVDTELARPQPPAELQPQNVRLRQQPAGEQQHVPTLRRQQDHEPTTEAMIREAPEGSLLDRLFGTSRKLYPASLGQ